MSKGGEGGVGESGHIAFPLSRCDWLTGRPEVAKAVGQSGRRWRLGICPLSRLAGQSDGGQSAKRQAAINNRISHSQYHFGDGGGGQEAELAATHA